MNFDFLIVCRREAPLPEVIEDSLLLGFESLEEEGEAPAVSDAIQITLQREVNDGKAEDGTSYARSLCGFTVNLEESITEQVMDDFIVQLRAAEGVEHVLKFHDDRLLERNLNLMREIFALEMGLRRALSVVYLSSFTHDYYALLRDDLTQIAKTEKPSANDMETATENEFFHLLFSQYPQLNQRPPVNQIRNLMGQIMTAADFEALQIELSRLPVTDEDDADFIAALMQLTGTVEKLRNCVAHNRGPSQTQQRNYDKAKPQLEETLNKFFERFPPES